MDKCSLTEALVAMLVEQDHVDGTNAVQKLRTAQANLVTYMNVNQSGAANFLNKQRPLDDIDSIITVATWNGERSLFS